MRPVGSGDEPPPGWRHPHPWREPQGGLIRSMSMGGPPIPTGNFWDDLLHVCGHTTRAIFSHAVCCALCSLDGDVSEPATQNRLRSFSTGRLPLPAPKEQAEGVLELLRRAPTGESDLKLSDFVEAAEQLVHPLELLGPWTVIAAREVRSNCSLLRQALHQVEDSAGTGLRAVLEAEKEMNMHKQRGAAVLLNSQSVAFALTWLHRFLGIWADLWRVPRPPTFRDGLMRAYKEHVEPYHSWLLRRAFAVATAVVPSWEEARELLKEYDAKGEAVVLQQVAALAPLLACIRASLLELQLLDTRMAGDV